MAKDDSKAVVKVRPIPLGDRTVQPPDINKIPVLDSVVGKNVIPINLRNNPELAGREIVVTRYVPKEGMAEKDGTMVPTTYLMIEAWILEDGKIVNDEAHRRVLMTGSENVVNRILAADSIDGLPVRGRLRRENRAWFLD